MGRALTEEELVEYNKQRRETMKRTAELMGISVEEIERIEAKARAELEKEGDGWEKELNERNKARAGIKE